MANTSNHLRGSVNPKYVSGIGLFFRARKIYKDSVRYCERCGKDLKDAGRYMWCVHHKDHDRTHNTGDNFELLCKSCHQREHECAKQLKNTYDKVCFFCGKPFVATANNTEYCPTCRDIWRNSYKGNYTREEAKKMMLSSKV